ncbi:TPA: restriction endonuclease [Bacillus anthracis]|nr:restriction endonuclease [Bacillus anthracis]
MVTINIIKEYDSLSNPPSDVDGTWFRARGYKFEKLLYELLKQEELEPRTSYKIKGEQIDGSFLYGQTVFLLEAKWHKTEMPASSIYEFKGKVDGKLIGTIGIFISMSGFSADAVDALLYGKVMNVILFDKDDFDACMEEGIGFSKVLKTKLRNAAEQGTAFYPYKKVIVDKPTTDIEVGHFAFDLFDNNLLAVNNDNDIYGDLVIICEGKLDQLILSLLTKMIMHNAGMNKKVSIIAAMGKYSVAKVAMNIKNKINNCQLIMVVDSDGDVAGTKERILKIIDYNDLELVIIEDKIEVWLDNEAEDLISMFRKLSFDKKREIVSSKIKSLDIEKLRNESNSFRKFYDLITNQ